jgi:hypothetical protein
VSKKNSSVVPLQNAPMTSKMRIKQTGRLTGQVRKNCERSQLSIADCGLMSKMKHRKNTCADMKRNKKL